MDSHNGGQSTSSTWTFPPEIMIKIFRLVIVHDYFTFRKLTHIFPDLTEEISESVAYFTIRDPMCPSRRQQRGSTCTLIPDSSRHFTESSYSEFFNDWFNTNIALNNRTGSPLSDGQLKILRDDHRYFEFKVSGLCPIRSTRGIGTFIESHYLCYDPQRLNFNPFEYFEKIYGFSHEKKKELGELISMGFNEDRWGFLSSQNYSQSDCLSRNDIFLEKHSSLFEQTFLQLRKRNKVKHIVIIVDLPELGINVDLTVVLRNLFAFATRQNNRNIDVPTLENISRFSFSLISLKHEYNTLCYLLDCGIYDRGHVSLVDCITDDVKLRYHIAQNELVFDFSDRSIKNIEEGFRYNVLRQRTPERHFYFSENMLENPVTKYFRTLQSISNFGSYDVVFFRNIEETYKEVKHKSFRWITKYKKQMLWSKKYRDIYQPITSIYNSPQHLETNLNQLQDIYNAMIEKHQIEVKALEEQLPASSSLRYSECFPIPKDWDYELTDYKAVTLETQIFWKRIELFNDFMHHLPWMGEHTPNFHIRMNLFRHI